MTIGKNPISEKKGEKNKGQDTHTHRPKEAEPELRGSHLYWRIPNHANVQYVHAKWMFAIYIFAGLLLARFFRLLISHALAVAGMVHWFVIFLRLWQPRWCRLCCVTPNFMRKSITVDETCSTSERICRAELCACACIYYTSAHVCVLWHGNAKSKHFCSEWKIPSRIGLSQSMEIKGEIFAQTLAIYFHGGSAWQ